MSALRSAQLLDTSSASQQMPEFQTDVAKAPLVCDIPSLTLGWSLKGLVSNKQECLRHEAWNQSRY